MKKRWAVLLIVLGCIGILQYFYFQFFTPLALKYEGVVTEQIGGHEVITEIIRSRDWMVGILSAIIGVIFVLIGGVGLGRRRKQINSKE